MTKRTQTQNTPSEISEETLERARQQAEGVSGVPRSSGRTRAERRAHVAKSTRRAKIDSASFEKRKEKNVELTLADIQDLLDHPTIEVTEEQLHAQYGYVLRDLRNMGILAVSLFIALFVLSLVL
ncbi:MAG: hypothetical protein MUF87_00065 [Anaerolineae bacterium]|jgi:hypothetical protein|nr:hypothetical protein [Anaerolineae bacterium]